MTTTEQSTQGKLPLPQRLVAAGQMLITGELPQPVEQPAPSRAALVKEWTERVKGGKEFWKPIFDKIREEMEFAAGNQWGDEELSGDDGKYQANIVQRHLAQKEASLYAKNPKAIARKRQRLEFKIWDGDVQKLQQAQAAVQQSMAMLQQAQAANPGVDVRAAVPPPPAEALALVADYENGIKVRAALDRVAVTLELVYEDQLKAQMPDFKTSMKKLVLTGLTCRVGWVKAGYYRETDDYPQATAQKHGLVDQLKALSERAGELAAQQDPDSSLVAELEIMANALKCQMECGAGAITREGLVFNFPKTTSIIVDPNCTELRGLVGARWLAEEFMLTAAQVFEAYGVRLNGSGAVVYAEDGSEPNPIEAAQQKTAGPEKRFCVWEIYDHATQLKLVVCDGFPDFLEEPGAPMPALKDFWPYQPLVFNRVVVEKNLPEKDVTIYPTSDVRLLMPLQKEINRSRDCLRLHRIHALPRYAVSAAAALSDADATALASGTPGVAIKLNGMAPGEDVAKLIQPIPTIPPSPAVYDTQHVMTDVLTVVGSAEANLGPVQPRVTATQSSIAEGSRISSVSSNVDDLDDLLTWMARAGGEILLGNMSRETVTEIAGPGAEWPEFNREQIAKSLFLEIQASSSGRPNRNMEVQNFQILAPLLQQIPGIKPDFMAREGLKRLDDRLELADAYDPALAAQAQMQATLPAGGPPAAGNQTP